MKKKIKIYFVDFWSTFIPNNNIFYNLLKEMYDVELDPESPDILFYSVFGINHLRYRCKRVFFTGENCRPNFNECDWAFSFDFSDNPRNYRLPLYALMIDAAELTKARDPEKYLSQKDNFCTFIYSNPGPKKRTEFFHKLSKYKFVHSAGKYLNNIGGPLPGFEKEKRDYISKFKFTFAFENSKHDGYTTEKILDPLLMGSIPLYWGNELVYKDFNPKSFLNYNDFSNDEEFIEKIIEYDNNKNLYLEMLSEPPFENNNINEFVDNNNIKKRLKQIVETDIEPIATNLPDRSQNNFRSNFRYQIENVKYKKSIIKNKFTNLSFNKIIVKHLKIMEKLKK